MIKKSLIGYARNKQNSRKGKYVQAYHLKRHAFYLNIVEGSFTTSQTTFTRLKKVTDEIESLFLVGYFTFYMVTLSTRPYVIIKVNKIGNNIILTPQAKTGVCLCYRDIRKNFNTAKFVLQHILRMKIVPKATIRSTHQSSFLREFTST